MFDATKLPTAPCDPTKVSQPEPGEVEKPEFVRAPAGPGFLPNVNMPHPMKGTR